MITKVQFNILIKELGLDEAIKLVRIKLGKKYSNLHIRFDEQGELLINKVAKRTKTQKPKSDWMKSVIVKRIERKHLKKMNKRKRIKQLDTLAGLKANCNVALITSKSRVQTIC